jgi:hypothetical protein
MLDESELRLCPNVKFSVPNSTKPPEYIVIKEASGSDRTVVSLDYLSDLKAHQMLPAAMCRRTSLSIGERISYNGRQVIALTRLATCARKCETTEGCLEKKPTLFEESFSS